MVGDDSDFRQPGKQHLAPEPGRRDQAAQRACQEVADEPAEPLLAGERVADPCPPAVRAQSWMPDHGTARPGVPVEVERVAESEPRDVAERLSGQLSARPIDNPGDDPLAPTRLPGPEIAVHHGARSTAGG